MNGYQAKSVMLLKAITAIHKTMSDPVFAASYQEDYELDKKATESALMGLCTELTHPLWIDWMAVQRRIEARK